MTVLEKIHVGVVGVCGRGAGFKAVCDRLENVHVQAVCDTDEKGLEALGAGLGAPEKYVDYEEMLERAHLDAVILATPMPLHVPQAIQALRENLHVLSEVPAGVSIEECRRLVEACKRSDAVYMMAENMCYFKHVVMVTELARRGMFGTTYYAEGEYLHEIKEREEKTPWRRTWQTGVDGITYGTHSLGPILHWMPGDRVVSVCCAGSGHHYEDPRHEPYHQDTSVMLGRMGSGGLVNIRLDLVSSRPAVLNCNAHQLQGTEGCFESARARGEKHRVWLRSVCGDPSEWLFLDDLEDEFLPPWWKGAADAAMNAGHSGSDHFTVSSFANAIETGQPPAIGIHEAMDMTLPGLVSQQSIQDGGTWLDVPDSRRW